MMSDESRDKLNEVLNRMELQLVLFGETTITKDILAGLYDYNSIGERFRKDVVQQMGESLDHEMLSGLKSTHDTGNAPRFYIVVRFDPTSYIWSVLWHTYYLRESAEVECEQWLDRHYPNNWFRNTEQASSRRYYLRDTEEIIAKVTYCGEV